MDTKEKMDNDSIDGKAEYASSEYSNEIPPPAYKTRSANSVKIAKIAAFTIILSSFILGSFMLASTYLQAKATCDQVSVLDAVLDKELMLEAMQQELPRPEALQTREKGINIIQDLSKDEMNKPNKKDETHFDDIETINTENETNLNDIEKGDSKKVRVKLPLDFDLTELGHNLLMKNKKSNMNCVVERHHIEEQLSDNESINPFNVFLEDQPKEKVTNERISIFCETIPKIQEPIANVRKIIMPYPFNGEISGHDFGSLPRLLFPFQPQNQMNFQPILPQMPLPQAQLPFHPPQNMPTMKQQGLIPPIPAQMMSPPRPEIPQFRLINTPLQQRIPQNFNPQQNIPNFEGLQENKYDLSVPISQPETRIQLRRIQIPGSMSEILPFLNSIKNDLPKEVETPRQHIQVQQMPLAVALSKVGITPDDLRNIQRMAEEKFQQHIREFVTDEDNIHSDDSYGVHSEEGDQDIVTITSEEKSLDESNKEAPMQQSSINQHSQILTLGEIGRSNFGRSLNPIQLPARTDIQEERADYAQPR